MRGHEAVPGAGRPDATTGYMAATSGAQNPPTRQQFVHADTVGSTVITAEIPAVPPRRSYGVLLPDGTVWYPDSKRRMPAPWALRMIVWVLALFAALGLAGLLVIITQPSWFTSLRHTVTAPSATTPGVGGGTNPGNSSTPTSASTTTSAGVTSSNGCNNVSGGVVCTIPSNNYTLAVTTGANRVFYQITEVSGNKLVCAPGSGQPAGTTQKCAVSGTTTLKASARGASAVVTVDGRTVVNVGAITYQVLYTFQPGSTGSTG